MKERRSLVTYCGGYCNDCWIRNGKLREMGETFRRTLQGWVVPERAKALADREPGAAHYAEFERVLDWIGKQTCEGCRAPGSFCLWGDPVCAVRDCARAKGVQGCFECSQETRCETIAVLDRADPTMAGNRARMREIGVDAWEAEQRKVPGHGS